MKRFAFILMGAALFAASCNNNINDGPFVIDEQNDQICFRAGGRNFDAQTRASVITADGANNTVALTAFNVVATTGTLGDPAEVEVWNAPFSGNNTDGYFGGKFWPVGTNPQYHFYAANAALTKASTGGFTINVTDASATDVICAVLNTSAFRSTNTLPFRHILARLGDVTVVADSDYQISDVSLTFIPKVSGTYNLFTGLNKNVAANDWAGWSNTADGNLTSIATSAPGTKQNDIWLIPGQYTVTASWTAVRGDSSQQFTGKTDTIDLFAGKKTTVTTTLGGSASEIKFQVSVEPWGEGEGTLNFGTD